MKQKNYMLLFELLFLSGGWIYGLYAADSLKITVIPDKPDYLYSLGDTAVFKITVQNQGRLQLPARLDYRLTEDGERLIKEGTLELKKFPAEIRGALDRPGFLRLDLTLPAGKDTLREACGCGFAVEAIRPTNILPSDFGRFWREGRAELLRIPLDARVEPAPDMEKPGMKVYQVSVANIESSRIYGWLTVPDGPGPFPGVVSLPGAGVSDIGTASSLTQAGMIALRINIHGIEGGRDSSYYAELANGVLDNYRHFGNEDPYRFYYRRVILGAIRALDYLASRPDVDTTKLGVTGGSQGGALSLLVAGLDKRVKALAANVPAMCDHTGSLYGRPSGWPRIMANGDPERTRITSGYYDAALNAGFITVPALLAVGFIDTACPPTTVYAAYNNLKGPKQIDNFPTMGHSVGPGWPERSVKWLKDALGR